MQATQFSNYKAVIELEWPISEEVYFMAIKTFGFPLESNDLPNSTRYDCLFAVYIHPNLPGKPVCLSLTCGATTDSKALENSGRVLLIYAKKKWFMGQAMVHLDSIFCNPESLLAFSPYCEQRVLHIDLSEEASRLLELNNLMDVSSIELAHFAFVLTRYILKKQHLVGKHNTPNLFHSDLVHRAMRCMEESLEGEVLSVSDIAEKCHVSCSKLKSVFKNSTGTSVYKYYLNLRLDHAFDLLKGTHLNVSEAAYKIGYAHVGKFSKMFKERHGFLPSQLKSGFVPA